MSEAKQRPSAVIRGLNSAIVFLLGKVGLNLQGAEVLEVRGRVTGETRRVPVNPVVVGSRRYLLSPRGEASWVKNIRASREGALRHGRSYETFRVEEMSDADKVPVLRAYLDCWHWQVGSIMKVSRDADDATLREIAPNHPIFLILPNDCRDGESDQGDA
jgi:hypothetical protein